MASQEALINRTLDEPGMLGLGNPRKSRFRPFYFVLPSAVAYHNTRFMVVSNSMGNRENYDMCYD